jgi:hypothetical protein
MADELEAVRRTAKRWSAADRARDRARDDHFAAVLEALRGGAVPTEVYKISPFTGTHLRGLARDAGIPAATRGKKPPPGVAE